MSRTSPTYLQAAAIIIVVIEILFLIYEAIMIGIVISKKDERKASLLEKLKENNNGSNGKNNLQSEEELKKVEDVIETVIIPIIFGVYVLVFTFSLILTIVLIFGVKQKRPGVISVWICMMTVFLILNLIYLLPAIILVPDFSSHIEIVNIVHQIYRIVAVIIICCYSRELRRHVVSGQSGEVYTVQYHIPPEQ